jgi:DNA invertase Pin-like site-specific DNA recombinase
MATMLAAFAQHERRLIGERTRAALAQKRAQGIQPGRPRSLAADVRARIVSERGEGETLQMIADRLNVEGVPTAQGGKRWCSATIGKVALSC